MAPNSKQKAYSLIPPDDEVDDIRHPTRHLLPLTQICTNIRPIGKNPSYSSSLQQSKPRPLKKPFDSTLPGPLMRPKTLTRGKENLGLTSPFQSNFHSEPLLRTISVYSAADSNRASHDEDCPPYHQVQRLATYTDFSLDSIDSTSDCGSMEVVFSPGTTISKVFSDEKGLNLPLYQRGGCYSSNSLESRLLKSIVHDSGNNDCSLDKDDESDELAEEPSTQLDILLNLCSEKADEQDDDETKGSNDFSAANHLQHCCVSDTLIHCPLCGIDISGLTAELRQIHTNDCIDNEATLNMACPNYDVQPQCRGQVVDSSPIKSRRPNTDVHPVLEWIRSLGLARYEGIFVQEEIDWESLQWLTEEDLFSIGVTALGPRKKIVHALSELRKQSPKTAEIRTNSPRKASDETGKPTVNKLITDFFAGSSGHRKKDCTSSSGLSEVEKSHSNTGRKKIVVIKNAMHRKLKDIPPWCYVPGTPFRVDAFKYLRRDCSHWFLTHFHIDHYQGLSRSFSHGKVYCSLITARLVNMKIGIPWDQLEVLPINKKISISGIDVTCFDANHCPGSILILFEPSSGKAVLHTGDLRFCEDMTKISVLQACRIQTLILDTTYCDPQYDFPNQEDVIQFVIEAIQAEAFNPKTLFLIGSYTVGKERLFLEVARVLRKKVYVTAAKLRLLQCLELSVEDMQWFTLNEEESHIHVVPMWTLASFKRLKCIASQYLHRFSLIVAFSPTGWTFGKGKKKTSGRRWQQGTIVRYEVPYSEHCSFTELREFVKFVSPENIVPSVNNDGPESASGMVSLLLA